jgi:hypothetical protein
MKTATEHRRPTHSHWLTNAFSMVHGKLGINWGRQRVTSSQLLSRIVIVPPINRGLPRIVLADCINVRPLIGADMALSLGKLLENIDRRINTETLDQFRDHLEASLRNREKSLEKEYSSLTEDQFEDPGDIDGYRMHLEDQAYFASEVRKLSHELCIVALYRQVELHTKRVAKRNFPSLDEQQLFNIAKMKAAFPFKLEALSQFVALDELRLLNNAIKHEGLVSDELAKSFPSWKIGEKLDDLDKNYERLLPLVQDYVKAFVSAAYANSAKLKV